MAVSVKETRREGDYLELDRRSMSPYPRSGVSEAFPIMRFFRRHWPAMLGIAPNLLSLWRGLIWLFDWEVRVEAVMQKLADLGGARVMIGFVVNPPAWLPLVAVPIGLLLIWWDLRRRQSTTQVEHKSIAQLEDADLKKQASKWLITKLSEQKFHIQQAALFGSIVHDHFGTSDVDVIVRFKPISDGNIGKAVRRIKGQFAQEFKQRFGHDLHVKFFCADEKPGNDAFVADTKHEEII